MSYSRSPSVTFELPSSQERLDIEIPGDPYGDPYKIPVASEELDFLDFINGNYNYDLFPGVPFNPAPAINPAELAVKPAMMTASPNVQLQPERPISAEDEKPPKQSKQCDKSGVDETEKFPEDKTNIIISHVTNPVPASSTSAQVQTRWPSFRMFYVSQPLVPVSVSQPVVPVNESQPLVLASVSQSIALASVTPVSESRPLVLASVSQPVALASVAPVSESQPLLPASVSQPVAPARVILYSFKEVNNSSGNTTYSARRKKTEDNKRITAAGEWVDLGKFKRKKKRPGDENIKIFRLPPP